MRPTLNRIAAFRDSTGGTSAVEFAFVAPILILLMFAAIEFGRAWWAKNQFQFAVERAARYAVICDPNNPGTCPSDSQVKSFAVNQAYGQLANSSEFNVSLVTLVSGKTVKCVSFTYEFTPWFVGDYAPISSAMSFTGKSCREIQAAPS
jgi:Flp pilus assembly protein TadG